MIPEFQDNGYLPAGVYPATIDEIRTRFGHETEIRQVQCESIEWLIDLVTKSGASRLVINGSFVTDEPEPNDVDCVVLIEEGFPRDSEAERELLEGLPFIDLHLVTQDRFELFINTIFATDRDYVPKGVVEVML